MNIIELEICNVRGIPHLLIEADGRNVVIWGLNGSGKSAVVDAIDFLLTGRISRLMGEGTRDITLNKHGPHIDHKPEESTVCAKIKFPALQDVIELKRCMDNPNDVQIICNEEDKEYIEFTLWIAKRGQHVLTRREILRYITAEAGSRAERIQDLLNIGEIEEIRRALVTVRNKAGEAHEAAKKVMKIAEGLVNATVGQKTYSEEAVLEFINKNREIVGGKPISVISSKDIQKGIRRPVDWDERGVSTALIEKDIQNIRNVNLEENKEEIDKYDTQLREVISYIKSDPTLLRNFSCLQLAKLGINLIDESGSCPLCDKAWPPGKLEEYLEKKISTAKEIAQQSEIVKKLSSNIASHVTSTIASIEKVIEATKIVGLEQEQLIIKPWLESLHDLLSLMNSPLEKYPDNRFSHDSVIILLAPSDIDNKLMNIQEAVKNKFPEATPEQNAWDVLIRLGEDLTALENAKIELEKSDLYLKRASVLYDSFQSARDKILGKLYGDIRDRFVYLYRQLHRIDEYKFAARIEPSGAGLDFEVDFHGRGTHPPHALHSEGHQDSMGFCLYLALAERLNRGLINLIILDDVIMSVDIEHRRQICDLLATSFPDRQFIITTHDKTWANQLRSEGVVRSSELIEFHNWTIETGPQVNYGVILWDEITEYLERNDVPKAAFQLRRGLECFFSEVCDSLEAFVHYNVNHQWELGDWYPAAMKQYRELIKKAKISANSWDARDVIKTLNEREKIAGAVFAGSQAEQWAVNANVHYNNWANFVKEDFMPVVEAFKDVCNLFVCGKCGAMLRVTSVGHKHVNVRCRCSQEDWNLVEK